jgi:uncharacterized membrane protein
MTTRNRRNRKNSPNGRRAAKKAAVLGTERKSPLPLIAIVVSATVIIAVGILFFFQTKGGKATVTEATGGSGSANAVALPVALFEDGKAHHFEYKTGNGLTIKYFVIKSSDGIIRAAFDACDVCWPAAKGYYQEGDFMVCRNCGRRFASIKVNEVKGGCNPAPLERQVVDGKLIIKVRDIVEGGKLYFDFSNRSEG